jgi:hypothetical protein
LLARRQASPPGPDALVLPDRGTILAYRAVAGVMRGEGGRATRELEEASPPGSGLQDLARALRRSRQVDPRDFVRVSFAVSRLLMALLRADSDRDPRRAPLRLVELARELATGGRADLSALAFVRGARAAQRIHDGDGARDLLESAWRMDLNHAPSVRCLVGRLLGEAVLDVGPARAERLGRESAAPWEGPEGRTAGEVADAWLLVARACRLQGDMAGADQALDAAAAANPPDTRQLRRLREGR